MSIRAKIDNFLSSSTEQEKDLILNFLIESQMLEYGITYLLTGLPFLNGPEIEEISNKTLGALINELERTKDNDMLAIAAQARKFNNLRKDIVHNLIHMDPLESVLSDVKEKIILARSIQDQIDEEFDYIYQSTLNIPYGSIF